MSSSYDYAANPAIRLFIGCILAAASMTVLSESIIVDANDKEITPKKILLPYAFYTESLDLVIGLGGGVSASIQPQAEIYATVFVTNNESAASYIAFNDFQLPFARRIFVDFIGALAYFTDQRIYSGFNPAFPGEHAGSNDSDDDNYLRGEGRDNWYELKFTYLLPVGNGKHTIINTYTLNNGLLVDGRTGGETWSPKRSGRTKFELSLFDRHRTIRDAEGDNIGDSNGTKVALEYDNRDFSINPSQGSLQKVTLKKDFGILSSSEWTVLQLDLRKYFNLGSTAGFRQRILALDFWTSYTPSWQIAADSQGAYIDGRPPNTMGSTLGGFYRFRAYPVDRFSDKAAVYYAAELRLIPDWNPLSGVKIFMPLDIDWLMVVPFVEAGRVAPHWSPSELHRDIRTVFGIGLRMMAKKNVFRLDMAMSEDSWSMYAMVRHPF